MWRLRRVASSCAIRTLAQPRLSMLGIPRKYLSTAPPHPQGSQTVTMAKQTSQPGTFRRSLTLASCSRMTISAPLAQQPRFNCPSSISLISASLSTAPGGLEGPGGDDKGGPGGRKGGRRKRPRIYLDVPYHEKPMVFRLNYRWDKEEGAYYCYEEDKEAFSKWIPRDPDWRTPRQRKEAGESPPLLEEGSRVAMAVPYSTRAIRKAKALQVERDPDSYVRSLRPSTSGPAPSPLEEWVDLRPDLTGLVGEDRSFWITGDGQDVSAVSETARRRSLVVLGLAPSTSYLPDIPGCLAHRDLVRVRGHVISRTGEEGCECCGRELRVAPVDPALRYLRTGVWESFEPAEFWHVLERWEWDEATVRGVQRLKRLLKVCRDCHALSTLYRVLPREGPLDMHAVLKHVDYVSGLREGHPYTEAAAIVRDVEPCLPQALQLWQRRSGRGWEADLSLFTGSGIPVLSEEEQRRNWEEREQKREAKLAKRRAHYDRLRAGRLARLAKAEKDTWADLLAAQDEMAEARAQSKRALSPEEMAKVKEYAGKGEHAEAELPEVKGLLRRGRAALTYLRNARKAARK